jgi:hypothetical protein
MHVSPSNNTPTDKKARTFLLLIFSTDFSSKFASSVTKYRQLLEAIVGQPQAKCQLQERLENMRENALINVWSLRSNQIGKNLDAITAYHGKQQIHRNV